MWGWLTQNWPSLHLNDHLVFHVGFKFGMCLFTKYITIYNIWYYLSLLIIMIFVKWDECLGERKGKSKRGYIVFQHGNSNSMHTNKINTWFDCFNVNGAHVIQYIFPLLFGKHLLKKTPIIFQNVFFFQFVLMIHHAKNK